MTDLDGNFNPHLVLPCSMDVYPENTGMIFLSNVFTATNHNFILGSHPHPNLLCT
jgi:hypothetical protein